MSRGTHTAEGEVEILLRSTLDALSAHIAVLDSEGTIVAVNHAWKAFARATGFQDKGYGIGMNYLSVCEQSAPHSDEAARTAKALRAIVLKRRSEYRTEYHCDGPDGSRWFQLRMTRPSPQPASLIVIAHEDITEVKRAHEALARLTSRLMRVQDDERRAIARELHDATAQNLLAIKLNATRLREPLAAAGKPAQCILSETLDLAEQCLQEVRTFSYLLHPPLLDDMGLASALRWFARGLSERSGIVVDVDVADRSVARLPHEISTALFRVTQEALSNVLRHSGSRWARIVLRRTREAIRLEVTDGGRGFRDGAQPFDTDHSVGVGIAGMRVRLEQLGGRLEIRSSGSGTCVTATMPDPARNGGRTELADRKPRAARGRKQPE